MTEQQFYLRNVASPTAATTPTSPTPSHTLPVPLSCSRTLLPTQAVATAAAAVLTGKNSNLGAPDAKRANSAAFHRSGITGDKYRAAKRRDPVSWASYRVIFADNPRTAVARGRWLRSNSAKRAPSCSTSRAVRGPQSCSNATRALVRCATPSRARLPPKPALGVTLCAASPSSRTRPWLHCETIPSSDQRPLHAGGP